MNSDRVLCMNGGGLPTPNQLSALADADSDDEWGCPQRKTSPKIVLARSFVFPFTTCWNLALVSTRCCLAEYKAGQWSWYYNIILKSWSAVCLWPRNGYTWQIELFSCEANNRKAWMSNFKETINVVAHPTRVGMLCEFFIAPWLSYSRWN